MPSLQDVETILNRREFRRAAKGYERTELIRMANQIGPPMKVLSVDRLASLQRLPSFDEGLAEDALEVIDRHLARFVEIFMISHRWLNSAEGQPDDHSNSKVAALLEFFKWRQRRITKSLGRRIHIYAWIDYSSFDQQNIDRDLTMLPLWVACCERILTLATADYHDRAWCRLEMLMSHAFQFADHHTSIPMGFKDREHFNGRPSTMSVLRPDVGQVTNGDDLPRIARLAELAYRRIGRTTNIHAKLYDFA